MATDSRTQNRGRKAVDDSCCVIVPLAVSGERVEEGGGEGMDSRRRLSAVNQL